MISTGTGTAKAAPVRIRYVSWIMISFFKKYNNNLHDIYQYRYCKTRPCADPLSKSNFEFIYTNINLANSNHSSPTT